nr:hypothetical protein [Tanacetum cinerariifolium]
MKVKCSCNRYESYGLLCRHAFCVLRMINVKEFSRNYLQKQLLKNVKPSKSALPESLVHQMRYIFKSTIDRLVHDMIPKMKGKAVISSMLDVKEPDKVTINNPG